MNSFFNFFITTWHQYNWVYLALFAIIFCLIIFNKKDLEAIKYIFKQTKEGKPIIDPLKKEMAIEAIKSAPRELFKSAGIWILVVIFALAMGSLIGFKYAEVRCNNFIYDNYGCHEPCTSMQVSPSIPIFKSDISQEQSNQQEEDENRPVNPFREFVP